MQYSHRRTLVLLSFVTLGACDCEGCAEKPETPVPIEDTAPSPVDTADPLEEAREQAVGRGDELGVHASDIARSLAGEIEAATHKPTKPRPRLKAEPETGSLPKAALNKVFDLHAGAFRQCYERTLKSKGGNFSGRVQFDVRISSSGEVRSARVTSGALNDTSMLSCMKREASQMKFPEPEGGALRVTKAIVFTPEN